MSSSVDDISNQHEQNDLSTDINQIAEDRKSVQFNPLGEAVGPNATHFKSQVGQLVRTFAPIRYISWSKVPKVHKDDIWNGLMAEYDVPNDLRKQIEKSMPEVFRKRKSTLRKDFLDKHPTLEAQKLAIPPKIRKEDWEQFCINESSDNQIQIRAKGVESRKRRMYGHTGGRKSAAMVEYEMVEKQKGEHVSRTEVWIKTHKKKDGSIPPNVKPFMDEVEGKVDELKKNKGSGVHPLSIENDPLTQVFGKKAKGLPGVGSLISKSKYEATLRSRIMYSEEKSKNKNLENKIETMSTQLDLVYGHYKTQMQFASSTSVHMNEVVSEPMPRVAPTPMPWMTYVPIPDLAPHSNTQETSRSSRPSHQKMVNNAPRPSLVEGDSATSARTEPNVIPRWCELLDGNNNCVAIAKEVIDPMHKSMCHNYRVKAHEMKVSVYVRKIYPAKLYKETPDAKTFQEVACGDFIVWPKSCIRFTDMEPTP